MSFSDSVSAGEPGRLLVLVIAQIVMPLKAPVATGHPGAGTQSYPDRKYSVPPAAVSYTPFGVVAGCTVPVVRPFLVCVRPSKCTAFGLDDPASSAALSIA